MSNHIESQAEKQPEIQTGSPSVERCLVFESGALSLFMSTNYVIEIINGHSITPIPMIPSFIKGILNLRGQILPVVDIRLYMGHEEMEFTRQTCIIVLQVDSLSLGKMCIRDSHRAARSIPPALPLSLFRIPLPVQ